MNTPTITDSPESVAAGCAPATGSADRPATIAYEMYVNVRHQHDLRVAEIGSLKAKLEYIAYSGLSARHLADYAKSALEEKDSAALPNSVTSNGVGKTKDANT
tara:strand:+ start:749 stop:1057 length:309 start_codon:yes stop_codon:yes gene_type:complete